MQPYLPHCILKKHSQVEDVFKKISPAEEVAWGLVSKGGVADESDGRVEESGGGDAQRRGLLHLVVLPWGLDGVLFRQPRHSLPFNPQCQEYRSSCLIPF